MINIRTLALIISAFFVARVLVTALGLLLSITPMLFELSTSETELKVTYEILVAYFLVVVVLLLFTSVSLFNQATKKQVFQVGFVITAIALFLCAAHLIVAVFGDPGSTLVQFALSFIWVPILLCFATLTSFLIARLEVRGKIPF
jgi:hypothetical protein